MKRPKSYQDNYNAFHIEDSLQSAKEVIPIIKEYVNPTTILDVGCGTGAWLSIWKKNGVKKVLGLDGNFVKDAELLIKKDEFRVFNLEKGFTINEIFDLVICLEVAEHLKPESAPLFINSLCRCGDIILFSAAIPGQEGTLHLNEQYPNYWVNLFAENGFVAYDNIREKIWANRTISWWYRQNMLFFIAQSSKMKYPEITAGEKVIRTLVHPELLEYKQQKIDSYTKILKNPIKAFLYFLRGIFNNRT